MEVEWRWEGEGWGFGGVEEGRAAEGDQEGAMGDGRARCRSGRVLEAGGKDGCVCLTAPAAGKSASALCMQTAVHVHTECKVQYAIQNRTEDFVHV